MANHLIVKSLLVSFFLFAAVPRQVICDSSEGEGEDVDYTCDSDSVGCYKRSDGDGGFDLEVWFENSGDEVIFNLTTYVAMGSSDDNRWVAIGFSGEDQLMGDDDVIMCIQDDDEVSIVRRWNEGRINEAAENETYGIQDMETWIQDGVVSCQFSRTKMVAGDSQAYDLTEDVFLLFGEGPVDSGIPLEHNQNPEGSDSMVDLETLTGVVESSDHHTSSSSEEDGSDDAPRIMGWNLMMISAAIIATWIYF